MDTYDYLARASITDSKLNDSYDDYEDGFGYVRQWEQDHPIKDILSWIAAYAIIAICSVISMLLIVSCGVTLVYLVLKVITETDWSLFINEVVMVIPNAIMFMLNEIFYMLGQIFCIITNGLSGAF